MAWTQRGVDPTSLGEENLTPIQIARSKKHRDIVLLLEKFTENPEKTRHDVRLELGIAEAVAVELFALVIFLCDGLCREDCFFPINLFWDPTDTSLPIPDLSQTSARLPSAQDCWLGGLDFSLSCIPHDSVPAKPAKPEKRLLPKPLFLNEYFLISPKREPVKTEQKCSGIISIGDVCENLKASPAVRTFAPRSFQDLQPCP